MPPPSRGAPDVLAPASTEVDSVFMPESRARPAAQALRLSEDTLELLERRKPTVQESTSRATRSRLRASQNSTSQEVRCECKTLQEETDMVLWSSLLSLHLLMFLVSSIATVARSTNTSAATATTA
jgi:hypothetical protein